MHVSSSSDLAAPEAMSSASLNSKAPRWPHDWQYLEQYTTCNYGQQIIMETYLGTRHLGKFNSAPYTPLHVNGIGL